MLDGACRIPDLVKRTKQLGMTSLAISDHGVMHGAIEFYNECRKEGIKPIIGLEAYIAPKSRHDRVAVDGEHAYHLLLLAQNLEGYQNLLKLSSISFREGFYYKARVDEEILREFNKGIIATSACLGGEVASAFMKRNAKASKEAAEKYLSIFGPERFFIEVQKHIPEQDAVNPELVGLAKRLGVGLVGTNDVHFLNKEDHFAHSCLCCISMGRQIDDENKLKYSTELYLKSPAEMKAALGQFDGAMENTQRIADMVDLELDFSKRYAPVYRVPPEKIDIRRLLPSCPTPVDQLKEDERYLRQLCEEGLTWRYGTTEVDPPVRDRLEKELKIICMKGFCSYFLIVWDFCNYARDNGIPVGARGSGVGTMVGYLLGLCNVDPLRYGLLFERFMDPSRNEMPDIDIDICQDGRQKVIEYVRNKYGHVAQIITFGTLAAKAACKDVGRVMGVPLAEIDRLTKLIPGVPGMTIDKAMSQVPEIRELYDQQPQIKKVIDIARRLEGLCRNAGTHAAGVIIADQPLDGIVPLFRDSEGNILTQYEGPVAEKCGLLKMDFLGLRTLSTLTRAVDLVKQTKGVEIDIEKVDLTDKTVLDTFCRGETKGVFQFESGGMQDLLMKMQPDRVEDLIAANALYRPGPMALIPSYCDRKHGREEVPAIHPIMDGILAETYGIMCIHQDTRIALADGREKPIRDVRAGDRVHALNPATRQFEPRECHGCGPTRSGAGIELTLENGFSVTVTPDHKVLTYDGFKEAGQLDPQRDIVAAGVDVPQERPTGRHFAPWLGEDESVAYLIGTLIGDGCLTASGCTIATGRESDHIALRRWLTEKMPTIKQHDYLHGRCWYLSLFEPTLLNHPEHGNRKTRFHHWLNGLGINRTARNKHVPEQFFTASAPVRASLLAGLLDSDGCTAVTDRGSAACFFTSVSADLLQDVRRLAQLAGLVTTIRKQRIQFWNTATLRDLVSPYCIVRRFEGKLHTGRTVGWVPREVLPALAGRGSSIRALSRRTGILRAGLKHDFPFVKTSTAAKAGLTTGAVRFYRIAKVKPVENQQFYGMSVEQHHNLLANGIVIKNCYQEQVMQIFNQLGGIELSDSYKLIKAISKKTVDVIAKFKPAFIKGTTQKGVSEEHSKEIFDLILKFGGYGFNKSHSSRYAIVAFQTAYMKTYHPVEYMAALLTYEMGDTTKVVEYIDECRKMKVPVLPPDVNLSDKDFTPVYVEKKPEKGSGRGKGRGKKETQGVIRFGLCAVRGVGEKAVESIIAERKATGDYKNIYEFCERIDTRSVQKSTAEALTRSGAFASTGARRRQILTVLEPAFEAGQALQNDKRNGQFGLFVAPDGGTKKQTAEIALPNVPEFEPADLLKFEKELLGFYITSHPLTQRQDRIDHFATGTTRDPASMNEGTKITIGGLISGIKSKVAKTGRSAGQRWAIVEVEDLDGKIEGMCFAEVFTKVTEKYPDALKADSIVFVSGKVDRKRENPVLIIDDIVPIDAAVETMTSAVVLNLDPTRHNNEMLQQIRPIVEQHKGKTLLGAAIKDPIAGRTVKLELPREMCVRPSQALVDDLEQLLGNGSVTCAGQGTRRLMRQRQQELFKSAAAESAEPEGDDSGLADIEQEFELAEAD